MNTIKLTLAALAVVVAASSAFANGVGGDREPNASSLSTNTYQAASAPAVTATRAPAHQSDATNYLLNRDQDAAR
jgi:uncharacterized protein YdeI (BOF family)